MENNDYNILISSIVNRLIKEKNIFPQIQEDKYKNQTQIKIMLNKPEWYLELDDDTKYSVEYNIKEY